VTIENQPSQTITGEGLSGSVIYTQTTPLPIARINFSFDIDSVEYQANADYLNEAKYQGAIDYNGKTYSLNLIKKP
jgi:hypothetical protein